MAKLKVMNSTIGRSPAKPAPIPRPAKPCSVIGVSITRRGPNSCSRPWLTLYAPWYSATSSPSRNTVSSRRISSAIASRNASRTVIIVVLPVYVDSTTGTRCGVAGVAAGREASGGLAEKAVFSATPTSSPLAATTAIGVLTATCSVPSGITILASTPSSIASTSIVALSVSISASTSPALTGSPSLFSQRAILPSVMVGDRAGIRTSVAMARPGCLGFGQHVGPQVVRIGLGAVLCELRRFGNDVPNLGLKFSQLALAGAAFEQPMPDLFDWIVLGAHPGHLLAGAVFSRVRH